MHKKIYKATASVLAASLCFALVGCSKEAPSEAISESASSVEPETTAESTATPEPSKELTLTKLDVEEPNNIAVNGYLELPTVDGPYWQIVEDRLNSKNLEVYHRNGEEDWTTAIFSGHTVYDYVADDGSLQKCIISGYEVFDLNNASDEIEYPNDTTQLRKEKTCERIYIYNSQDEYDAAVKNREEGQAILNGEEAAPERCVILNGSIVPNLQYEVGDDGKIRISMRDLSYAYSSQDHLHRRKPYPLCSDGVPIYSQVPHKRYTAKRSGLFEYQRSGKSRRRHFHLHEHHLNGPLE